MYDKSLATTEVWNNKNKTIVFHKIKLDLSFTNQEYFHELETSDTALLKYFAKELPKGYQKLTPQLKDAWTTSIKTSMLFYITPSNCEYVIKVLNSQYPSKQDPISLDEFLFRKLTIT